MKSALFFLAVIAASAACFKWESPLNQDTGGENGDASVFDVKAGLSADLSVWPNTTSYTNSDAWLIQNHDQIRQLKPRVLVIDFQNKKAIPFARGFVDKVIAALAEGSKYHGYKNPSAVAQLSYSVVKFLDLRDTSGKEVSDLRPHNPDGSFYQPGLFDDNFARYLGYKDPATKKYLRLGELFDRGIINECWVIGQNTLYEGQGRIREYDSAFHFTGKYYDCVNACYDFGEAGKRTSVSIRLGEINLDRGAGCATHAFGHSVERMALGHIPYLEKNAARFFDFHLDNRFGAPFSDLYSAPYYVTPREVFSYSDSGRVIQTINNYLPAWSYDHWGTGCGSVHFAPNAAFQYDDNNTRPVLCTCENYGLKNGPDGNDLQTVYTNLTAGQWNTDAYNDCGGAWQIYLRQNIPGYGSGATGDDGKPMKSWWPFFFY